MNTKAGETGYHTLNCRGKLLSLDTPRIMGILNVTPDSFSDGGKFNSPEAALEHTDRMLSEGAHIIDIGGYSSRPGATHISESEEIDRIQPVVEGVIKNFPKAFVSVDTFRSKVAKVMLEAGAHIINDISAGNLDEEMMQLVASYKVPYIMMHMQGTPQDMQDQPEYEDVVEEVWDFLTEKINEARAAGIRDVILDPGFGFGKEILHNYQLLSDFDRFQMYKLPLLAGISRKSMMYKLLGLPPDEVVEVGAALHMKLLEKGANILRVHDVAATRKLLGIHLYMKEHGVI